MFQLLFGSNFSQPTTCKGRKDGKKWKKLPPYITLIQPVQPHNKVKMKTAGKQTCLNAVFAYISHQS